jgi:hypothetical protein
MKAARSTFISRHTVERARNDPESLNMKPEALQPCQEVRTFGWIGHCFWLIEIFDIATILIYKIFTLPGGLGG